MNDTGDSRTEDKPPSAEAPSERPAREDLELARARLRDLSELSLALAGTVLVDDVAKVIVQQGLQRTSADICTLYALNETGTALELIAQHGVAAQVLEKIQRITEADSQRATFDQLSSGQMIWAETAKEYLEIFPSLARTSASGPRAQAFWSAPLIAENKPVGLLAMGFYSEQKFAPDERAFVDTFAKQCAQALLRAQRGARESANRRWLSTTLQSIGDAVIACDVDGRVAFMNAIAERLTGWSERAARGRSMDEVFAIFSELDHSAVESPVSKVLREGRVVGLANHTVLRSREGREIPIADSGAPIREESGALHGVVLVFRDVSEEKKEEKRRAFLASATDALLSSLDYHETLATVARLAVPTLADWCAVDILEPGAAHPRQLAVAHADPNKVAYARELGQRYPPDPEARTGAPQVIRTGKSELYPEIPEGLLEAGTKDAEHLRIARELKLESAMVVPFPGRSGRALGALSFIYANSGRRYSESDLAFAEDFARRAAMAIENAQALKDADEARAREHVMRAEAERVSTVKDQFLATVSHELRTPLTSILGWATTLRRGSPTPEVDRGLAVIERNARAQARLIDDVLDISRITSGKLVLTLGLVDVGEAVRDAAEGMRPAAEAKGVVLRNSTKSGAAINVIADAGRLQQILWNLLTNAVKFTPRGGIIDVHAAVQGSSVIIEVADNGEGIRPSVLPLLFDFFRQADSSTTRRHGGLGLGLALVKQLAAAHGGSARATSEGEGKGATFTVQLPARAVTPALKPLASSLSPRKRDQRPLLRRLDGLSLLVLDDEQDARELLAEAFTGLGAQVQQAASAAEALEYLKTARPQLIVSDIGMPFVDGYGFIAALRAHSTEEGSAIPAIALTAFSRPEDTTHALQAGFQRHVAKPVDLAELVAIVAELCGVE